jgi:hypothetical protein
MTPKAKNDPLLRDILSPKPGCLSPAQLETLLQPASAAGANFQHLQQCPRCQAELAMLRNFEEAKPVEDEGAAAAWIAARLAQQPVSQLAARSKASQSAGFWARISRVNPFAGRPAGILAFAMAAIFVVGGAAYFELRQPQDLDLGHSQSSSAVRGALTLSAPIGDVSAAPREFRWEPVSGAAKYRVTVSEVDGNQLWQKEIAENRVDVPDAVKLALQPGKTLFWQVTALSGDGKVVNRSSSERFRLVPLQR